MLNFDDGTAKALNEVYQGRDFVRRRQANLAALGPAPGQRLLDIGCGTGLMLEELARAVGDEGHVTGLDLSDDMLALAHARVEGRGNVDLVKGPADALPLPDQSFDGAVTVQVLEYVPDLAATFAEAARVLRPGARLVIGDMLFSTASWHSDAPERMAAMLTAWDAHVAHTDLPAIASPLLRDAGFAVDAVTPLTFLDSELRPDGLAAMMLRLMEPYAVQGGHLTAAEARDWAGEQRALAAEGRFFFSLTHVIITARRLPG